MELVPLLSSLWTLITSWEWRERERLTRKWVLGNPSWVAGRGDEMRELLTCAATWVAIPPGGTSLSPGGSAECHLKAVGATLLPGLPPPEPVSQVCLHLGAWKIRPGCAACSVRRVSPSFLVIYITWEHLRRSHRFCFSSLELGRSLGCPFGCRSACRARSALLLDRPGWSCGESRAGIARTNGSSSLLQDTVCWGCNLQTDGLPHFSPF